MKPLPLATVRQHTGRHLSYDEACHITNPGDPCLRNMAIALSLHSWSNTAAEWLRLEAALVILRRKNPVLSGERARHKRRNG